MSACRFSVSSGSLFCFTSPLLLSLFVLEWKVRFKPFPGEGALGVSESNLALSINTIKALVCVPLTCPLNLQVSWPASISFQHLVCVLFSFTCLTFCLVDWGFIYRWYDFFFTFTGDLKCCELNVCVCKYMDEWVCVCAYVLYVYLSVCFTLIHSLWKPHASI